MVDFVFVEDELARYWARFETIFSSVLNENVKSEISERRLYSASAIQEIFDRNKISIKIIDSAQDAMDFFQKTEKAVLRNVKLFVIDRKLDHNFQEDEFKKYFAADEYPTITEDWGDVLIDRLVNLFKIPYKKICYFSCYPQELAEKNDLVIHNHQYGGRDLVFYDKSVDTKALCERIEALSKPEGFFCAENWDLVSKAAIINGKHDMVLYLQEKNLNYVRQIAEAISRWWNDNGWLPPGETPSDAIKNMNRRDGNKREIVLQERYKVAIFMLFEHMCIYKIGNVGSHHGWKNDILEPGDETHAAIVHLLRDMLDFINDPPKRKWDGSKWINK